MQFVTNKHGCFGAMSIRVLCVQVNGSVIRMSLWRGYHYGQVPIYKLVGSLDCGKPDLWSLREDVTLYMCKCGDCRNKRRKLYKGLTNRQFENWK